MLNTLMLIKMMVNSQFDAHQDDGKLSEGNDFKHSLKRKATMQASPLPADFLRFLTEKHPKTEGWGGTCLGAKFETLRLDFAHEKQLNSKVGTLSLHSVKMEDVTGAKNMCRAECVTLSDLSAEERAKLKDIQLAPEDHLCIFRDSDGNRFMAVFHHAEFGFLPWIDHRLTEQARRRNAELGFPAQRVIESCKAASDTELVGKEIVCQWCLHTFLVENQWMKCPHCKCESFAISFDRLLRSFFHCAREEIDERHERYLKSKCIPLQAKTGVTECYRLIVYCYWMRHQIVEVERTPLGATALAKAWDWREKVWRETANRPLSPAEWQRLMQFINVAPFWDLPPRSGYRGMDGADFTLEGLREGRYHFVQRWSPDPERDTDNFYFACYGMNELASCDSK
jgi:hypothetical protein